MSVIIHVNRALRPIILCLLLLAAAFSAAAQSYPSLYHQKFDYGGRYFNAARMTEAVAEFRGAQEAAVSLNDWAQALYWVIISELALADYGSALRDMDELEKHAPNSPFTYDMVYHRARAYFNQGFFEDALVLFKQFSDNIVSNDPQAADRKAAAFFWMGECLYTMGQFDEAENFYSWVVSKYPKSPKVEAAAYRIDLIKQKKIEAELLALLRWSHEESLRTSEDYQRKIKTYEHTLNSYQRRIGELSNDSSALSVPPPAPPASSYYSEDLNTQISSSNEPANNTPDNRNNELIEKARRLESDIQKLISEYDEPAGGF